MSSDCCYDATDKVDEVTVLRAQLADAHARINDLTHELSIANEEIEDLEDELAMCEES